MFIRPTKVTRITSGFRVPERKDHHGVDYANPGIHEIVSIADGTISKSYVSSSYGEVIFIVHNIDGQTYESVYAHLRTGSRKHRVGARVKQGEVIGIMGNTGISTGQHLHFELHIGRWNINKTNAVNGELYVNGSMKQYVNLHKHMDEWNHYPVDKEPIKKLYAHDIPLKPKKFQGLSYEVLRKGDEPNTYIVRTGQFGERKIFVPKDKDSSFTAVPLYK
ncbi:M23 family metallopeptidase [Sutcliffiella horikoshii]|uniref:M23 family metallopeptidase n=1 Tax=Sutcliffiella horikoshii TaxID=79883 RepID=UPI00203B3838|nr:M23 family metallopeptidase [Sutcliffiella horikoshii]MCM3616665.1 M23 family metallopeptidase [Sutcliffiella horikoshii]